VLVHLFTLRRQSGNLQAAVQLTVGIFLRPVQAADLDWCRH